MIALPIYLQLVLEYNVMEGLSIAPVSLSMFVVALFVGKESQSGARAADSGSPLEGMALG